MFEWLGTAQKKKKGSIEFILEVNVSMTADPLFYSIPVFWQTIQYCNRGEQFGT